MYRTGELVKIINQFDTWYGEMGKVVWHSQCDDSYGVKFPNGYSRGFHSYELAKYFTFEETQKLHKAHLLQLVDMALDAKYREWFEDITSQLKKMEVCK